jgi:hypothetical protein
MTTITTDLGRPPGALEGDVRTLIEAIGSRR